MERRTERAERQEKFDGNKAQEQRRYRVKSAERRAPYCQTYTDTRAAVCDEIHYGNAYKLHHENFHRNNAEFFRALVYPDVLRRIRLKDFKFFKTLNAVEEFIAHRGVFSPVLGENFLRILAYRDNRHRYKRYAADENERGSPVYPYADQKQYYRRDHRKEELRKITRKIYIELFYAFQRHLRQSRHAHSVGGFNAEF